MVDGGVERPRDIHLTTPDQGPTEAGPTAASTDDGGLTWLAIAAAVLVLAAVALGSLLGRRRS